MRNLIFANITRLKKSKLILVGIILSSLYTVFLLIMNYVEMINSNESITISLNWFFFSSISVAAIFCPIYTGFFIGTEYNDGTIRNKLIAGHKRSNIYIANGITIFGIECFLFLVSAIMIIAFGIPLFGFNFDYPIQFIMHLFAGILMLVVFAALFTMISMIISNRTYSVATCLIIYAILFMITNYLRIAIFSYYGEDGVILMKNDIIRIFLEFLYDFLPTGQSFQISSGVILHMERFLIYSLVNIIIMTIIGMFIFTRKDIK